MVDGRLELDFKPMSMPKLFLCSGRIEAMNLAFVTLTYSIHIHASVHFDKVMMEYFRRLIFR